MIREINKSEWVYDVPGGGEYTDTTMSCLGISDEQLLHSVAKRLSKRVKKHLLSPGHLMLIILKKVKRYVSRWCNS